MNNIQKLISELKDEKTKCQQDYLLACKDKNKDAESMYIGMNLAFGFALDKVELLLNTEKANSGQNGSANSGNAM